MGHVFAVGNPPINVTLRRSARARRMTLKVSRLDGRVTLSVPRFVRDADATDFVRAREDWLRKAMDDLAGPVQVAHDVIVPLEGAQTRIIGTDGIRRTRLVDAGLQVRPEKPGVAVETYLKGLARDRLAQACDAYSKDLGRSYSALSLRDTRSRWGSCSSEGRLMFSWRLAMAPPDVLRYVAAHEVAHLRHMNHSAEFWECVRYLFPNHAGQRRWLREKGPELHRFRFRD